MIDGNYEAKLGETVLAEADTIVWLDLPLWLKLRRIWRRTGTGSATTSSSGTATARPGATRSGAGTRSSGGWFAGTSARSGSGRGAMARDPRFVRLRSVEEASAWLDHF